MPQKKQQSFLFQIFQKSSMLYFDHGKESKANEAVNASEILSKNFHRLAINHGSFYSNFEFQSKRSVFWQTQTVDE